jgi:hypothetical protein
VKKVLGKRGRARRTLWKSDLTTAQHRDLVPKREEKKPMIRLIALLLTDAPAVGNERAAY